MRRSEIDSQNRYMLKRQQEFRAAADVVTDALIPFPEVQAIAVIGSVARTLWKEIPRFNEFRRAGIAVWHECGDIDLAVWINSQHRLGDLRRAAARSLREAFEAGTGVSVVSQQHDIFLIEPGTDRYLGRLCSFNECPKGKRDCMVPGCGDIPFNQCFDEFIPHADLLAPAAYATLFRRDAGRLRSALDLPQTTEPSRGDTRKTPVDAPRPTGNGFRPAAPRTPHMTDLWRLDATDLARLIRLGSVSATEATQAVLARLDAVNPRLNAVVRIRRDEALREAAATDAARARGDALPPLAGVPVTVKVNVDLAGYPNDNGVPALAGAVATEDSPVVANLRRAGAIVVGQTNTPAFSMRIFTDNDLHGRTVNPLDPAFSPGGSSGGAGVSVATGIGPIGHGNDIAGSVRIPAMCNGIVGLRVSLGRIPAFNPSQPVARAIGSTLMAVQGPLTRSVRDSRLALSVMAAGDRRDTRWADAPLTGPAPQRPIRVALVPELPGGFTHPAQAEAVRQAGRHLAAVGYAVDEILPPDLPQIIDVWHRIGSTDVFGGLAPRIRDLGGESARLSVGHWLALFPPVEAANVLAALAERDLLLQRWLTFMLTCPLVIMPTLADMPPPVDQDLTRDGQATVLDSLRACLIAPVLGLPSLSVPVGRHGRLRPSVQITASRFREDLCLDAGEVIEAAEGTVSAVDPAG